MMTNLMVFLCFLILSDSFLFLEVCMRDCVPHHLPANHIAAKGPGDFGREGRRGLARVDCGRQGLKDSTVQCIHATLERSCVMLL